jgi:hypothetical protein
MKSVNRRQFTKMMGGAALAAPLAPTLAWPQEAPKKPEPAAKQPTEAPKAEPPTKSGQAPLKLTAKQEEAVQKAIERRERQLAALRSRTLPYDAEPAFVFQVRQRPRTARKG